MNKIIIFISLLVFFAFPGALAQEAIMLTATLDVNTPPAKSLPAGAIFADVARIKVSASGYDIFLNGIIVDTDKPDGLQNFTNIYIYDADNRNTLLGYYPEMDATPGLVEFKYIRIANGQSRTFLVRASLSETSAGDVRVGFSGFTFTTEAKPALSGVPIYGNVMTLPGTVSPTPPPAGGSTPTPSPAPTPIPPNHLTPISLGFVSLSSLNLAEGDTISASGFSDPDIYIANAWGYKRLFLNPAIFGFYGHLGGFGNVKTILPATRSMLVTSGLFRNCETNDTKVYGVEVTGEDVGILHWINTTGEQAVADDPDFFKKVFCINSAEFNWYTQGAPYTSVNDVPNYLR